MTRQILSAALLIAGAALVATGVRSLSLSHTPLPPEPSRVVPRVALPVEGDTCCTLEIPRLKARIGVIEGTRAEDLERAPGHFVRSAAPGAKGNCAISGHRDTHFRVVRKLRKGDRLVLRYRGERFEYVVRSMRVIKPSDTWILDATQEPTLTLLTCYPFTYIGPAPKRFAVQAVMAGGN